MDAEWNYAMNHERAQVLDSLLVEEAQPGMWKHTRTEEIPDNSMITVSQTVKTVEVISDSDSGNSLFLTQHDEQPVRTLRRRRAEENAARQVYIESSNDEESPDTPDKARNPPVKLKSSPKSPPLNWRGKNYYSTLDLPFYDDLDKKKFLRRRQAFIIENAALGGFFKCIKKIKKSKAKAIKSQRKSSRSQKRCRQDSRRACSPPDIIEDLKSNKDHDEIKIVELKTLIPEYRVPREGFNPWQEGTSTPAAVTVKRKPKSRLKKPRTRPLVQSTRKSPRLHPTIPCREEDNNDIIHSSDGLLASGDEDDGSGSERADGEESQFIQDPSSEDDDSSCETNIRGLDEPQQREESALPLMSVLEPPAPSDSEVSENAEESPHQGLEPNAQVMNLRTTQDNENQERCLAVWWPLNAHTTQSASSEKEDQVKDLVDNRGKQKFQESLRDTTPEPHIGVCQEDVGQRKDPTEKTCGKQKNESAPMSMGEDGERCMWEDEETIAYQKHNVFEEREIAPELVQIRVNDPGEGVTEDVTIESDTGQPVGLLIENNLLAGKKENKLGTYETCKKYASKTSQNGDLSISYPGEKIIAECAAHTLSLEDGQHETQETEDGSRIVVSESSRFSPSHPESVSDSAPSDVTSENGVIIKKRRRENSRNMEERSHLSSSFSETIADSASWGAVYKGKMGKKKKKRKQENTIHMEGQVTEPPFHMFKGRFNETHGEESSSDPGVCSGVPEPVGDSGNFISEEGLTRKKKRKRNKQENMEEQASEATSPTVQDSQHHTRSEADNTTIEEGMRKKKKKRRKDRSGNVEEQATEPPSHMLREDLHQIHFTTDSSNPGVDLELVNDSVSRAVICEEEMMMKKKKKKQKVKKSGNTEKPVSDSPSWAEQQTKENEGSSRAHMESVDESVAGVVFCEEGKRKMKKKKRKDSQGNMDQQVGKPSCPTQQYNQHHIHAAGSTVQEERVKKKKNRKTDNSGNMEESVSEPPCQTFGDNQNQTQDDVGSSSPSICKHPYMNSSVTEPVGDPACSVAVHEEGVPKKTKKKRKRNNSGNGNNGNQEEEEQLEKWDSRNIEELVSNTSHSLRGSQQQQLEVTDSSTCEKRIKKKKKAKRENSKITEEQITEPPSYTRQNRLHETNEEAGSFHSGLQGIQHLTHTRADNSVPEGGMKKKKKNKKKDKIANLEEQPTEPPFLILGDSLHQVSGEADSSSPGVGLEHVGNSASRAVICEEGMMKKKRQKADKSGNTEEHVVVSPSLAHKEPKKEKESSRTRAQPLGDSPSGMIFCEEGMRKIRKEKKKKRKRERQGNMEQQVDEPPSPTQQDSQQHIQDEADSTVHEGMKKKRKKSKSGKMEEQVTK